MEKLQKKSPSPNRASQAEDYGNSLRSFVLPVSILLTGIALSISLGSLDVREESHQAKAQVISKLANMRAHLESEIRSTFDVTEGIVQLLRLDGRITSEHFNGMAKQAIASQPQIRHIALAPKDVVYNVFPLEGNEGVLGLDYRKIPNQYGVLLRSREQKTSLLAGPVELVQGGKGFIHRRPVFVSGSGGEDLYWGNVSVVADVNRLLNASGLSKETSLQIVLRGADGLGAQGNIIFGEPTVSQKDAITTSVDVPGGSWELAALPKDGWPTGFIFKSPLFIVALTCTAFFTYFAAQLSKSHKLIRLRHAELAKEVKDRQAVEQSLIQSEARFRALFERSPDPIWILRASGVCIDANSAALSVFGFEDLTKLYRIKATDIAPPMQSDGQSTELKAQTMLKTALATGVHRFEWLHKRADGTIFPAEVTLCTVTLSGEPMLYAVVRDISERIQAKEALLTQKALLQDIVDNAPSLIYVYDTEGKLRLCNRMFEQAAGYTFEEMEGKTRESYLATDEARILRKNDIEVLSYGGILCFEDQLKQFGQKRIYLTTKCVLRRTDGLPTGVLGISTDITDTKQKTDQLHLAGIVLDHTADGVIITNARGNILSVNRAYTIITGFTAEESIGIKPGILISEKQNNAFYRDILSSLKSSGFWRGELWNRRKDGELYPEWMTINAVYNDVGKLINYVAVFSDISAINRSQSDLERMSHYDPITALPNRALFHERLQHSLDLSLSYNRLLAVIVLDLDGFKTVNDSLGHSMGDLLLQQAAARFVSCIQSEDIVCRLGGDEFAFILGNLTYPTDTIIIARKLLASLQEPFDLKGSSTLLTASIGISVAPRDSETAEQLLRQADTAMYGAKEGGRNDYRFYQPEMTLRAQEKMNSERLLRRAVLNHEFEVWYQPKVNLLNDKIAGAEALVRWRDPIHGLVSPADFIPLAENTGLIIQIGEQVIDLVCGDIRRWTDNCISHGVIAINVAALQIERSNYVETIQSALEQYDLPANVLEVEVTESLMMASPEHSKAILSTLQSLGISTSIDDFGTGYSSLAYLKLLPIDSLKIDRTFISDLPHDKSDVAITKTIVELGHALGFRIIAEGVETEEQNAFLKEIGCDQGQGYLYGRPMPAADFENWLNQRCSDQGSSLVE
ncbi:EAL domain-containing protein [Pseudomonas mandelii]|uniref:bifunctional diguanylate cyclase/phosphodiesterase n=1 Tax=Pseudomonas mandelii TaxID=75612 RepID=UPI00224AF14E|nr:EAL domain-containing protein [Pseudomonas mandelii]MCX2901547.1 EAL domain-containing protein [Pseudomonas mandelii]